ncbi:hypothetical protein RJT34_24438 [Clitoria ternatea]|uniref:Uncharacterized protein n=1 Tax=Clitoria ternatea TaxID=43366 RepID=A0AAN9FMV8_CLITE
MVSWWRARRRGDRWWWTTSGYDLWMWVWWFRGGLEVGNSGKGGEERKAREVMTVMACWRALVDSGGGLQDRVDSGDGG